ncbi:mediator of RNA polymerase II transcription subunit 31 [Hymenobacter fodinae]|uniref:Uncharacterized protein n=1 Tax=Hymenobacter fodinae TaxID=2510796 RepID=A0A4Z0P7I6_9BACT|nr:hypothetical protein [Hymenobacter fodinae]TGE08342.1 hypothetical protein EU556_11540 [Hymenobacter fodinae]
MATQLTHAREGSQEEFALKAEAIQAQQMVPIAGIDTRHIKEDQAAQEDKLRAEATKQTAELEFQQALANLDTHLAQQGNLTNQQYADGQTTKAQHEPALAAIEKAGGLTHRDLAGLRPQHHQRRGSPEPAAGVGGRNRGGAQASYCRSGSAGASGRSRYYAEWD